MKKVLTVFTFLLMGAAVQVSAQTAPAATTTAPAANTAPKTVTAPAQSSVKFEKTVHDFGELEYNADGSYTFQFKNTGKEPVIIKNVQAACGCTTPSYSKEPIMPGKMGSVTARYDTHRVGTFAKTLTVNVNDENIVLTIKGNVKPQPEQAAPAGK